MSPRDRETSFFLRALRTVGVVALVLVAASSLYRSETAINRVEADQALRAFQSCVVGNEARESIRDAFDFTVDFSLDNQRRSGVDSAALQKARETAQDFLAKLRQELPPRACDVLRPGADDAPALETPDPQNTPR